LPEVEPGSLFRIKVDVAIAVEAVQVFCPETHDSVGTLLEVLFSDGDVQNGELGVLVTFEPTVKEIYGTVFFQGYVSKPAGKRSRLCRYTVISGWYRDSSDGGIGVGMLGCQVAGAKQGENYYPCFIKEAAEVGLHVVNLKVIGYGSLPFIIP
jgi:hypothetical protein